MFKYKNTILFVMVAVAFLILETLMIHPILKQIVTDDSLIISEEVGRDLISESIKNDLRNGKVSKNNIKLIHQSMRLQHLFTIRVFDRDGYIIYSSEKSEIGVLNTKDYFNDVVKKGKVYKKVAFNHDFTAEKRKMNIDATEIYVPIMDGNVFLGSFEVYRNIAEPLTSVKSAINNLDLLIHSIIFIIFIVSFLSERKANKLLSDSKGEYKKLIDNSPSAIFKFKMDKDGKFSIPFMSERVQSILGVPAEGVMEDANNVLKLIHPTYEQEFINGVLESARHQTKYDQDIKLTDDRYIRVTSMPVNYPDGSTMWDGFLIDVTEYKNIQKDKDLMQQQLVQSSKLADIGMLAAGVAHEINNPLAIAYGNLEIAELEITEDKYDKKRVLSGIKLSLDAINRIKDIVQELRLFAKIDRDNNRTIKLYKPVNNTLKLIRKAYENLGITLNTDMDKNIKIIGNNNKIQQVILNVLSNAKDAVKDSGKKTIDLNLYSLYNKGIIEIKDTGCGMSEETLNKVFEVFYTTKGQEGTGLGMGITLSIIKDMKGDIKIKSKENEGTVIKLEWPLKKAA